jgi:hypothetical protein
MSLRASLLVLLGTCALSTITTVPAAQAKPSEHPFEIEPGSFHVSMSTSQAAAHEDLTTSFDFAHEPSGASDGDVRTTVVNLPAGFVGNNTAVPTCTPSQLLGVLGRNGNLPQCPVASQVGQITLRISPQADQLHVATKLTVPVYNMEVTSFGVAAELGFKFGPITQTLTVSVRPGDTGLSVTSSNIIRTGEARDISVTIWGLPASHEHDAQRGEVCDPLQPESTECFNEFEGPQPANIPVKPFLSNPTSCGPFFASTESDSWEEPESFSTATAEVGPVTGCDRVPFEPSLEVQPTTRSTESATGLNVSLLVPQTYEDPFSIATANLKDTTVTLPQGVTINPSAGSGLGACTPGQYESETSASLPGAGCPPESKIGSIEIETPVLADKIPGAVYVATPHENPFGALLALYIVAKDPARGVIIKVAGHVELNPVTGQLTTIFPNTPQQPFSKFTLKFRPGATAPLVSPAVCGSYSTEAALTPWSAPLEPRLLSSTEPFTIGEGARGGPCPSGGVPPLHPKVVAGTQNNAAGTYSPFYLRLERQDGEQELTRFSTVMPPGLTGNLTGIPFCPDAAVRAAKERENLQNGGTLEREHPSCPAASEVGHSIVEAGVGNTLAQTPGKIYLAGPYNGAPLSLVSITSATVGPFDLGTVVIRFALNINPNTAQVEVSANGSDPIPHIIQGIVVHVRNIRVYVDRASFIINPTSCERMQVANTITGAGADPANPADQQPVNVTSAFQAADCANLAFKPKFSAATSSKDTFNVNGASLTVRLSADQGPSAGTGMASEANIRSVKVELPKTLPSRLPTLQKACTAAQFDANPAGCPAASMIGYATVHTPILPVPLTGPAIFVSHGGEAFPSLVLVLQGYGVTVQLVGETFISKAGITSSTFKTVPDQPFSTFELTLPQGKYSALAATTKVCRPTKSETVRKRVSKRVHGKLRKVTEWVTKTVAAPLVMPTEITAQNGAVLRQNTKIAVEGCPKTKRHKAKKAAKRG